MCLKEGGRAHNDASPSLWLRGLGPAVAPPTTGPTPDRSTPDPGRRLGCIRRDKYCPLAEAAAEGPAFICVCFFLGFDSCVVVGYLQILLAPFSGVVCLLCSPGYPIYTTADGGTSYRQR